MQRFLKTEAINKFILMSGPYIEGSQGPISYRRMSDALPPPRKRGRTMSRSASRSRSRTQSATPNRSILYSKNATKPINSIIRLSPYDTIRFRDAQFPASLIVPLKYVENVSMDCNSGATNTYLFRLNSLYDPNRSGTGHQPYMFDQLSALYDVYVVTGCKATVTFTTEAPIYMNCAIHGNKDTLTPTNIQELIELKNTRYGAINDQTSPLVLSKYFSMDELWGSSRSEILSDDAFQGTASGNPTAQGTLHISSQAAILTDASSRTVNMNVSLKYYVVFKQPKTVSQS